MSYTFISYSRKQLYFAESVVLALQRAGLDVWFDLQKLHPGIVWSTALKEGYENCGRLVLIASQSALDSPYVQVEWESALKCGREVIVVLSEAVQLPESLRTCAIYDARAHFDGTINDLAGYLRGEVPARHDPPPLIGQSLLRRKMPFDIWFTVSLLYMPTLTVWLLTLLLPVGSVEIGGLEAIQKLLPGSLAIRVPMYVAGFLIGLSLAQTRFPAKEFLQHAVNFEDLKRARSRLLEFWGVACLIFVLVVFFVPNLTVWIYLAGTWVVTIFLFTLYWSLRVLPKSADLLRWLPAGEADQDVRESVQAGPVQTSGSQRTETRSFSYALHFHPADDRIAQYITSILKQSGCLSSEERNADVQFVLVSNRTSMAWLREQNASLPGRVINILLTNIHTAKEIQDVLQTQWVDFRNERGRIIQALASHIGNTGDPSDSYALQITPTSFNNAHGFPRSIRLFMGATVLLHILIVGLVTHFLKLPDWSFFPFTLPLLVIMDALIMRRLPLPDFLYRLFGWRLAWFAAPALRSADPIGNSDRYFVADKKFLLLDDVLRDP